MQTLEHLIKAVQREARRSPFPIDNEVYAKAGKDPTSPVLFAGSLAAPLCFFGRDLGKDEVALGEPLIGAAGKLVRRGVFEAWCQSESPDPRYRAVLNHILLTNTVPFKPPGNKAYTEAVKARFRPYIAELLAVFWRGDRVITLGTEAFAWFAPYAPEAAFKAFWQRPDRYEAEFGCTLHVETSAGLVEKPITLAPLPHPSPLNQRWYAAFPGLLAKRLAASKPSMPRSLRPEASL